MKRIFVILCYSAFAGCLCWFFPLFHVVRNESVESTTHPIEFNAAEVAKAFWNERLVSSLKQSPDAIAVLSAFREDPPSARTRFGRKAGVGRTSLFVLRGSGTIVAIDKKGVGIALQSDAKVPDVILQTGLLFGNTVRDATGLLDASSFADSRQFNEVSTELNRLAETHVISPLKEKAVIGRHIDFAGCVEISDETKVIPPLAITPLNIRIE